MLDSCKNGGTIRKYMRGRVKAGTIYQSVFKQTLLTGVPAQHVPTSNVEMAILGRRKGMVQQPAVANQQGGNRTPCRLSQSCHPPTPPRQTDLKQSLLSFE